MERGLPGVFKQLLHKFIRGKTVHLMLLFSQKEPIAAGEQPQVTGPGTPVACHRL